jgi:hypothetical protein
MGFFSSLFGGSNPTLNAGMKQAGQTSTWANTKGQGLTGQAGDLFSALLGGDPKKMASLLAPQIATQQQQGQQAKQTAGQFGNRSGGTNAAMQTTDDKTRANISSMISDLTGKAATGAASMGQSLIDTGLTALGQQMNMSQQQMENWSNSIFGRGITSGVAAGESAGLNYMLPAA